MHEPIPRFDPLCFVLGWLLPGMGHVRIGQRRRGTMVMVGVLLLFFLGILVGGVDVVDRKDDWLWFLPQVLVGPLAMFADYLNQTAVKTRQLGKPGLAAVNEYGTLFVALAGLMNLATMIDAATRPLDSAMIEPGQRQADRRRQRRSDHAEKPFEPEEADVRDSPDDSTDVSSEGGSDE